MISDTNFPGQASNVSVGSVRHLSAILGLQWGDEGKGKVVDSLSQEADVVVRFQGGSNAGHTIYAGTTKYVFHLVPSGMLHPTVQGLISHGVVVNPLKLIGEIEKLESQGLSLKGRLFISSTATVITPFHIDQDTKLEAGAGASAIGTTKQGIGPAYTDKISRKALKVKDLYSPAKLREFLTPQGLALGFDAATVEGHFKTLQNCAEKLEQYLCDSFEFLERRYKEGAHILYEGGQGALLDVEYGTYPFVTSSSTTFAGIYAGAFVPRDAQIEVIGIIKPYVTRVGGGPFPTLMEPEAHQIIQTAGKEFGATTGRPRKCGWLDLPLLHYAVKISQVDVLGFMKLDILQELSEIKICVGYEWRGKKVEHYYPSIDLEEVKPLYEVIPVTAPLVIDSKLTAAGEAFIKYLEQKSGVPVRYVGTGPERLQLVVRG